MKIFLPRTRIIRNEPPDLKTALVLGGALVLIIAGGVAGERSSIAAQTHSLTWWGWVKFSFYKICGIGALTFAIRSLFIGEIFHWVNFFPWCWSREKVYRDDDTISFYLSAGLLSAVGYLLFVYGG
jgi:hypothetical protein